MPSSRVITVPLVLAVVRQLNPQSILDIGIGFGKFGYLFREYTDIVNSDVEPARYGRDGWKVRIEGIEGCPAYVHDGHRFIYNQIHLGNAVDVLPRLGRYDLIFLGDVIEHFTKEVGMNLLRAALDRADQCVMLTTPKFDTGQGTLHGNPLETHHSVWTLDDFKKLGPCKIRLADSSTYVVAFPCKQAPAFKLKPLISRSALVLAARRFVVYCGIKSIFGKIVAICGKKMGIWNEM